ncbi:MAG: hypothetical protein JRJ85_15835 [Deltaproteobacteria bacterium]|nr:hypothetical protein [Deltaproteobacteria bacterium]
MFQRKSLICIVSIIFLITASAAPILAQEEEAEQNEDLRVEEVVYDFVLLRPLGLAATTLGAAFWVITSPFTVWGGNWGKTAKVLIKEPGKYTFSRPIGAIDEPYPYEDD